MSARIRFCTWCKQFAVLDAKVDDHVEIQINGAIRLAKVNGLQSTIGDGICEACRREHFPKSLAARPAVRQ
jgi:hypothetical protein